MVSIYQIYFVLTSTNFYSLCETINIFQLQFETLIVSQDFNRNLIKKTKFLIQFELKIITVIFQSV